MEKVHKRTYGILSFCGRLKNVRLYFHTPKRFAPMNAQATALLIAVGIGTIFTSAFVREAVDTPMVLRVEADAVSATDAMEKSAEGFTRETGVQVAVEKYGYESSTKKATEDLASKTGKYDIVIQNNDALGKFASQGWIFTVDELEKESGKKADFEDDLFPRAWRGLSWYKGVRYGYPLAANTMFVLYRKDMIDNAADKQAFR
ncbi:MAG: extracellular solute-binding protein, partial [Candidatus Acidiferrales bacterium]